MRLSIPRGIVYHKIKSDVISLLSSLFFKLDDPNKIRVFEEKFAKYMGCKFSISFPFARTAIYYALRIEDFPAGTEIIMPPISIKAILDVVLELKLKPVFVDIDLDTLSFDIDQLKSSINGNTKAIIITYLFGMVPNIPEIISVCNKNNLFIIEDFSQCLNGKFKGKKVGSFGDIGVYSSSSIKTLDTYGGGLVVSDSASIFKKMKKYQAELHSASRMNLVQKIIIDLIRNVATSRLVFHTIVFPIIRLLTFLSPNSTMKHTGGKDVKPIITMPELWFESYTSFQASLGIKIIDSIEYSDSVRIDNVNKIKSIVPSLNYPRGNKGADNNYWQFISYFDEPKVVQKRLQSMKVDVSTTSLEKISGLESYSCSSDTPNADYLYKNGVFIPCYPGLSGVDINYISSTLRELENNKPAAC
jgi:perosamine synthetase